jgi:hypothetical protein
MTTVAHLLARAEMHERVASSSEPNSFTERHHRTLARRRRLQADLLEIRMRERARAAELV